MQYSLLAKCSRSATYSRWDRSSTMREFRSPDTVHPPAASYSHHVEIQNCRIVMTSGQVGIRPDGTLSTDPIEQLDTAFDNVARNLTAASMTMTDVVKLVIYLVGDWPTETRRQAIARHLNGHAPTMSVVSVVGLETAEMLVEIEATAADPTQS